MAKKKGFTLSEVMIAMTVLGVIAAILVPVVMKAMPQNNKVLFRKAYSTIEKSVSSMISDETNYPSDLTIVPTPPGTTSYSRGFNNTTATTNTSNKFCYFLADQLNLNGAATLIGTGATGNSTFTTTDGIAWTIYTPVSDTTNNTSQTLANVSTTAVQFPIGATAANSYLTKIIVDVNGATKPNCTADTSGTAAPYSLTACSVTADCTSKPDQFIIGVRFDGKLQISASGSSDACAASILANPLVNQ